MLRLLIAAASLIAAVGADAATLRVGLSTLPPSQANPFRTGLPPTVYATSAIFDTVTRFGADAVLEPALAIAWERRDALTWRFHLRPGVRFSNGTPFAADAVVNAVGYLSSDAAALEGMKREMAVLVGAVAVDDLTVDIMTRTPAPLLPRLVAGLTIAEPRLWRQLGRDGFARAPVGTGPFAVSAMGANAWKLSAFTGSWRAPKVDALEIVALPEPSSRIQALQAGRIDIALELGPDNLPTLAETGKAYVGVSPSTYGISFITTRPGPLADARVRRAINLAVDRDRLNRALLGGITVLASQPAARGVFGYDPDIVPFPYDPAAAKRLLAEAGYANGFAFTLDAVVGAVASDAAVFQQIQADLRAVSIAMTVHTMPSAQFFNKLRLTDFEGDAFPTAWPAWPALDVMRAFEVHGCERPVPWFCDRALAPQMAAARTEPDAAKALALRRALGRAYHDAAPALFLYETPQVVGLGRNVSGFTILNGLTIVYDRIAVEP